MKITNKEIDKTMLTITVGFLVIYWFTRNEWLLITSLILGIIGVLSQFLSRKIDFLWTKLAWILSLIIPNIVMSVVFYLILTPIAWFSRIFGPKNPLNLKDTRNSLFKERKQPIEKSSFEKAW